MCACGLDERSGVCGRREGGGDGAAAGAPPRRRRVKGRCSGGRRRGPWRCFDRWLSTMRTVEFLTLFARPASLWFCMVPARCPRRGLRLLSDRQSACSAVAWRDGQRCSALSACDAALSNVGGQVRAALSKSRG